jgi:hypothetical protein
VTQRGGMMMSVGGEVAPGKRKEGDNVSWADTNLIGPKIKNPRGRFSCYK